MGLHEARAVPVTGATLIAHAPPRPRGGVQEADGLRPPAGPTSAAARELAHAGPLSEQAAGRARAEDLACLV